MSGSRPSARSTRSFHTMTFNGFCNGAHAIEDATSCGVGDGTRGGVEDFAATMRMQCASSSAQTGELERLTVEGVRCFEALGLVEAVQLTVEEHHDPVTDRQRRHAVCDHEHGGVW